MFQRLKKSLAIICALALAITCLPVQAEAAAKPAFAKTYGVFCENGENDGVYTFTVKNLKKKQYVKWNVTGTGKSYAALKSKTTKAKKNRVTNKLTINTNGAAEVSGTSIKVVAKVYSEKKELICKLATMSTPIMVNPSNVVIEAEETSDQLVIGKSYQYRAVITPANAEGTCEWSATNAFGADASSCITQEGVFTPADEGAYTIKADVKVDGVSVVSATRSVTAVTTLIKVRQIAASKVIATYSGNAKNLVKKESFKITNSNGTDVKIKDAEFSDDGTEITLTTYSTFVNAATYSLTDQVSTLSFYTSIGVPKRLEITTTQVTVGKNTAINYAVYDQNDIDVTESYPGTLSYKNVKIINGNLIEDKNQIYMASVGDSGTFTVTYTAKNGSASLETEATVTCTEASTASKTNFTLVPAAKAGVPDYAAANYEDNRKVTVGSNYIAYFRALDLDDSVLNYETVTYETSDPDTLLINPNADGTARVTAIRAGTVRVTVTGTYAKQTYPYQYDVTITDAPHLDRLSMDKSQITISNTSHAYTYREYATISATDQLGEKFPLNSETGVVTSNQGATGAAPAVTYDSVSNRIEVNAINRTPGSYGYTLTITCGGYKESIDFTVKVVAAQTTGNSYYQIVLDQPVVDLGLTTEETLANAVSDKTIHIRVAEYRGDAFYGYSTLSSVTIMKDGLYYTTDLTKTGTTVQTPNTTNYQQEMTITPLAIEKNVCTKALAGVYTIEVRFPAQGGTSVSTATFEIKDSQMTPEVAVARTTANASCRTALELAKNCLEVKGVTDAVITDCTVTGNDNLGSTVAIAAGESVNIKTVTIQVTTSLAAGDKVISNYTIGVAKTLKNM